MSPPEIWGPATWTLFHTLAEHMNDESIIPQLFNNIKQICMFLPCPECSKDATQMLSQIDINKIKSKEQLISNVKEWVKIDTEILKLKAEIKERANKKKGLTESLVSVMKTNKIDCFDITGGSILYKKNTLKKPLNSKTLLSALQKYYKNDAKVAEELAKHIMDSRDEQIKETILMKGS